MENDYTASLGGLSFNLISPDIEPLVLAFQYASDWARIRAEAWFWPQDFTHFVEALLQVNVTLAGEAILTSNYKYDLNLRISGDGSGIIHTRLFFENDGETFNGHFILDQSYLPPFIIKCQRLNHWIIAQPTYVGYPSGE